MATVLGGTKLVTFSSFGFQEPVFLLKNLAPLSQGQYAIIHLGGQAKFRRLEVQWYTPLLCSYSHFVTGENNLLGLRWLVKSLVKT
jgi:hypothetical protein